MDERDRQEMKYVALGASQATFIGGLFMLPLIFILPSDALWVPLLFGPAYLLVGGYIWWALSRFHWTMPTKTGDND